MSGFASSRRAFLGIAPVLTAAGAGRVRAAVRALGAAPDATVASEEDFWREVQGAFDVFTLFPDATVSLSPYVRYEQWDTQARVPVGYARNPANDHTEWTLGLGFQPIDQLILKADWQLRHNEADTGVNQWNVALGYVF